MDIDGKTFTRTLDGKSVKVISTMGDVAILENNQRVSLDTLVNSGEFTELNNNTPPVFDGKSTTNSFYNSLINSTNSPNTSVLSDDTMMSGKTPGTGINMSGVVESHTVAQQDVYERAAGIQEDPNAVAMLKQKAIELQKKAHDDAARQANQFNDNYLQDVDKPSEPFIPGSQVNPDGSINAPSTTNNIQQPVNNNNNNPMTVMFKGFKRVNEFKCKIEINEMIPNFEMMKMFEDGYEMSIIDYFTDEILNKISSDPNLLRKEIKKNLEIAIYGKQRTVTSTVIDNTKANLRNYKKSKNKIEFLKSLKNKKEVIALGTALKVKMNKTSKRGDIEKQILNK